MIDEHKEIEQDINASRVDRVERKQSVTERTLDEIGKSLYDSRRDHSEREPIYWKGEPKVEPTIDGIPFTRVFQCGKLVANRSWSEASAEWGAAAAVTDYLAVPFDVTKLPYYVLATGAASWAKLVSTWFQNAINHEADNDDPRKDAVFYQISMCAGDQHVILT